MNTRSWRTSITRVGVGGLALAALLSVAGCPTSSGTTDTGASARPWVYDENTGYYYTLTAPGTYDNVAREAAALGGSLAVVDDPNQADFLRNNFADTITGPTAAAYTGLTYRGGAATYLDGTPATFGTVNDPIGGPLDPDLGLGTPAFGTIGFNNRPFGAVPGDQVYPGVVQRVDAPVGANVINAPGAATPFSTVYPYRGPYGGVGLEDVGYTPTAGSNYYTDDPYTTPFNQISNGGRAYYPNNPVTDEDLEDILDELGP